MRDPHTVADHLLDRPAELGVGRISGVPGDHGLAMFDHVVRRPVVEPVPVVHVVGAAAPPKRALHPPVHDTSRDDEFGHADITCARAVLTPDDAVAGIDRDVQVVVAREDVAELPATLTRALGVAPPTDAG